MRKDKNFNFFLKCIILCLYAFITVAGFYFFKNDAFDVVILALVISLLNGSFVCFNVKNSFHGIGISVSFSIFYFLTYREGDFLSSITFSLIFFDYFLYLFFNYWSMKLYQKDIDFLTLKFITLRITPLDIFYTLVSLALYISWLFYIANPNSS